MRNLVLTLLASLVLSPVMLAQQITDCNESIDKMRLMYTEDQGKVCIKEWEAKVAAAQKRLEAISAETDKSNATLAQINADLKACNETLYSLLGATDADMERFAQRLGVLEGKVRDMQRLPNDVLAERQADVDALERELNAMRGEKLSIHPEFHPRIINLARDIRGLRRQKQTRDYVVGTWAENRDCLWTISEKPEIYGDPFQWPKIWQGNTDQIRNPDIIFPGQRLKVPPPGELTTDEQKAARSYWRKKRAAAAAAAEMVKPEASATPAPAPAGETKPSPTGR